MILTESLKKTPRKLKIVASGINTAITDTTLKAKYKILISLSWLINIM
jgi:hypothetical protein